MAIVDDLSQGGAGKHRGERNTGSARHGRQGKEAEKMENSGNEATEWLKTKEITFFGATNYARFARKLVQTEP